MISKTVNLVCGTITILVGILFMKFKFLIPPYALTFSLFWTGPVFYPSFTSFAYYFVIPFYVIMGLSVIYSSFNYRQRIFDIMIILAALIGAYSSVYYLHDFIKYGISSGGINNFNAVDPVPSFSVFVNSFIPSLVCRRLPTSCVLLSQLVLIFAMIIIAFLRILNRPKSVIRRNILAGVIGFIVLVLQVLSRFYYYITCNVAFYFTAMMPSISSFLLSSLSCVCVAYCLYRILSAPNKLKTK